MPRAARHTAMSPMSAVLGWLPGGAQAGWLIVGSGCEVSNLAG
jgi:hypothetical protein